MDTDARKSKGSRSTDSEEDWEQLSDLSFRRRIQNRISQRKHRENLKRQRQEESESSLSRSDESNFKSSNKLVWMQPNTISTSTQQKRTRASVSAKITEDITQSTSSNGYVTFDAATFPVPEASLSSVSSGSIDKSHSPYRTLNMNGQEIMDSMEASQSQLEDLISSNPAQQQQRLQTPESPCELINGNNFLDANSSGTIDLLDENLDLLLFQYHNGDMFQRQLPFSDKAMSFDMQLTAPESDDTHMRREIPCLAGSRMSWNGKDISGFTSLHLAAQRNHVPIVKLLLESGLDIGTTTNEGETALHLAASEGHIAVAQLLLENHAPTCLRNHKGETALHTAAREGHHSLVALLLDYIPDPNTQDFGGQTALHTAVKQGHEEVVRLMMGRGVDIGAKVGISSQKQRMSREPSVHSVH